MTRVDEGWEKEDEEEDGEGGTGSAFEGGDTDAQNRLGESAGVQIDSQL